MIRLKYALVMVSLAGWFVSAVFFVKGSFSRYALLFVVTAYALAVLLLALSALGRRGWNQELSVGLEKKFFVLPLGGLTEDSDASGNGALFDFLTDRALRNPAPDDDPRGFDRDRGAN